MKSEKAVFVSFLIVSISYRMPFTFLYSRVWNLDVEHHNRVWCIFYLAVSMLLFLRHCRYKNSLQIGIAILPPHPLLQILSAEYFLKMCYKLLLVKRMNSLLKRCRLFIQNFAKIIVNLLHHLWIAFDFRLQFSVTKTYVNVIDIMRSWIVFVLY